MKTPNCPTVERSGEPLTPSILRALLDPQQPGESLTLSGPVQCGALNSRIRNAGRVVVWLNGGRYDVSPDADNAQQFCLSPTESFSRGGLRWGYLAFSNAIESGEIKYL